MNIFVLTGAGISAESGLGTFRDGQKGIWSRFDPLKLATPRAFAANPAEVHAFYNSRRRRHREALPNPAHLALSRLGSELAKNNGRLSLATQNVDDLHERAGSASVIHMHGELLRARCVSCSETQPWHEDLTTQVHCPHCSRPGTLRPDVVWFGGTPLHMDAIYDALMKADLFAAIGTSGSVYPAAGFVEEAKGLGIRTCEINLQPSDNASVFDDAKYGSATEVVPQWVDDLLAGLGRQSCNAEV